MDKVCYHNPELKNYMRNLVSLLIIQESIYKMSNSDDRELFLENIKAKSLSLGLDDKFLKNLKI